jgi:hypothetical protein
MLKRERGERGYRERKRERELHLSQLCWIPISFKREKGEREKALFYKHIYLSLSLSLNFVHPNLI